MKQKNTKKAKEDIDNNIFFEVILIIMIIPIFSFLTLSMFYKSESVPNKYIHQDIQKIIISTEKKYYRIGENVTLFIENNSNQSIYLEPCEYQNRFEKKVNGKWQEITDFNQEKNYDKSGFNRKRSVTDCSVVLSSDRVGTYRSIVQVFYDCRKPGEDECGKSEIFYSNEFGVL